MSQFMKSLQFGYLGNREKNEFQMSDNDKEDFNFKYIPLNHFKHIVKNVKRRKIKTDEEIAWVSFIEQQDIENRHNRSNEIDPESQIFSYGSLEEVDSELLRLEEDALPELNKRIHKENCKSGAHNPDDKSLTQVTSIKDNDTGNANLLITIPEENYLVNTHKFKKTGTFSEPELRKSVSAGVPSQKRDYSERLLNAMNNLEYSSSPELSPDRSRDKEDVSYMRPDPVIASKILVTQRRISELLDEISYRLDRIPLPDGDKDLYRRQQRVTEFSIRFARNYLYDLSRQVTEIRRHVNVISPGFRKKIGRQGVLFHLQIIEQKLAHAHQLLLHALRAYCKHIPSSVLKGHPGKLKEILQIVLDLKEFCEVVHLAPNFVGCGDAKELPLGEDTDSRCSAILSKLRLTSGNESQMVSHTTRSTLTTPLRSKGRNVRKQKSNRLNMYNIDTRLPRVHRRRKPGFYSKKEGQTKTVSPIFASNERLVTPEMLNLIPITQKSGKRVMRDGDSRISVPVREDDIRTVMEVVPTDSESNCSIGSLKEFEENNKLQRFTGKSRSSQNSEKFNKVNSHSTKEGFTDKVDQINEEHLPTLVPFIFNLMSFIRNNMEGLENSPLSSVPLGTLLEIIQKHHNDDWNQRTDNQSSIDKNVNSESCLKLNEKLTGSKNMQLIHLKSREINENIPKFSDASCQVNENRPNHECFVRDEPIELEVSEDEKLSLLKYQYEFQSSYKSSPMYSTKSQNKPWDIVAWISDKLVNELIVNLSKELQIDDVIRKLFELEFQDF